MSSGLTTFNSRVILNKGLNINNFSIDETGALISSAKKSTFKNLTIFEGDIEIDSGIKSANGKINLTTSGKLSLSGELFIKDKGTFRNGIRIQDDSGNYFVQFSKNTNSYINIPSKNFGIGTAQPKHFLHVNGNIYGEDNLTIIKKIIINPDGFTNNYPSDNGTLNVGGDIEMPENASIKIGGVEFNPNWVRSELVNRITEYLSSNNVTPSEIISNNTTNINSGFSPWRYVNGVVYYNQGNVGIGTDNPLNTLHVNGNTKIDGQTISLNGLVYYNGKLLDDIVTGLWDYNNSDNNMIYIAINTKEKLGIGTKEPAYKLDIIGDFHVTEDINTDANLYVNNNVGIGTTNPQYKLDVNGDLRVSGNFFINDKKYEEQEPQNVFWMQFDKSIYYLNKVGINIDNPQYDLHVIGDFYLSNNAMLTKTTTLNDVIISNGGTLKYGDDEKFLINSDGNCFINGVFNCNKLTGDIPSDTTVFNNQEIIAVFKPNTKIFQLFPSINLSYQGIGVTKNGMAFSGNGDIFGAVVPYGIDTSKNTKAYNGIIQTYKWDSINKIWYFLSNVSTTLTGASELTKYSSTVKINNEGNFIALSTVNTSLYKITFYILSDKNIWTFINFISISNDNAGEFFIMDPDLKYLFVTNDIDSVQLYINNNLSVNENLDANFTASNNFITSTLNNIGNIKDLQQNNDCSIFIISSNNTNDLKSKGVFSCYAYWSPDGNPNINNSTPFTQLGANIVENYSFFGNKCDIAKKSNIDTSSGDYKTFNYDITVAVGSGGLVDIGTYPSFINIYKFNYNSNNNTSGVVYNQENSPTHIDGNWDLIGEIKHTNVGSQDGFGTDFKLNNDGTIIYVGSCNENCIYIFKYDSTASNTVDAWPLVNKIQGFKSGDTAIGYRIACNFNKNIFATSSNDYINTRDISKVTSNEPNKIRIYEIDYNN